MLVYLIRHARTHGAEGICYGRREVSVMASDNTGAARAVRGQIPAAILRSAPLYHSPLGRCAMLARELAGGRSITPTPSLLELDFGTWEGRPWDEIPREELDAWARDLWGYAPGRGECARAAAHRWRDWVDSLPRHSPHPVIAVTHAGLIRVAHAAESSSDPALLTMEVQYGATYPLRVAPSRVHRAAREAAPT
jgi:alpha-ribazole phosphatase